MNKMLLFEENKNELTHSLLHNKNDHLLSAICLLWHQDIGSWQAQPNMWLPQIYTTFIPTGNRVTGWQSTHWRSSYKHLHALLFIQILWRKVLHFENTNVPHNYRLWSYVFTWQLTQTNGTNPILSVVRDRSAQFINVPVWMVCLLNENKQQNWSSLFALKTNASNQLILLPILNVHLNVHVWRDAIFQMHEPNNGQSVERDVLLLPNAF